MRIVRHVTAFALVAFGVACAGGASVVRPNDVTGGNAVGDRTCDSKRVAGDSEPFAVDWPDTSRASLEGAMGRGVAVVKYSCDGVEVLKGCSIAGEYAYRGISKKTKVIKMKDQAEIAANLGPARLPISVEAEVKSGRSLNLAYALVGNASTTVQTVSRDMLKGRCEGATHFVFEASLGAFAMATTAAGEAKGAAEVFSMGKTKASADSAKSAETTDGDLDACAEATDGATSRIDGCQALVRVTLFAIADSAQPTGKAKDKFACGEGYTYDDGACVKASEAKAPLCEKGDQAGCKKSCAAGNAASCERLANVLDAKHFKDGEPSKDLAGFRATVKGMEGSFKGACEAGHGGACLMAAYAFLDAKHPADAEELEAKKDAVPTFVDYVTKGCKAGDTSACEWVSNIYSDGFLRSDPDHPVAKDGKKLVEIVGLACDRGAASACLIIAGEAFAGVGVGSNEDSRNKLTVKYLERACTGGMAVACTVGGALQSSKATCERGMKAVTPALRKGRYAMQLFADSEDECPRFSKLVDDDSAKEQFGLGCKQGDTFACSMK